MHVIVLDDVIGDPGRCFVFARWLDNSDKGDKAGAIHARAAGLCHQYRHQHEGSQASLTTANNIVNRYLSSSCSHVCIHDTHDRRCVIR